MKKRLLYIGVLLITFSGIAYYKYGIFTDINYFSALKDIDEGKVQILTYGLPIAKHDQIDSIALKYGFAYHQIEDCTVTQRFINQVDSYNSAVSKHLSKINGSDWETRFENDVNQLFKSTQSIN